MKRNISTFVGARIREYRKRSRLTQKELGEKVGVKHNTISSYENGTNEAEQEILFSIAEVLNVSVNDFFPSTENEHPEIKELSNFYAINEQSYDYYNTNISAGLPVNVDGITHCETISIPDAVMGKHAGNKDTFILRVNGDSMNKIIPNGSLIAVKPIPLETLKNGDMVVFSDEHKYSVKSYFKTSDTLIFKPNSTNNDHHDQTYKLDTDITIHGKVVLYIVELD